MGILETILSALGAISAVAPSLQAALGGLSTLIASAFGNQAPAIEAGLQRAEELVIWASSNATGIKEWAQQLGVDIEALGTQLSTLTAANPNVVPLSSESATKLMYVAYNLAADLKIDIGTAITLAQTAWAKIASAQKAVAAAPSA